MNKKFISGLLAGLLIGVAGFSFAQSNYFSHPSFQINIAVEFDAGEVEMECFEGCHWETLSFGCGQVDNCAAGVDQRGVGKTHDKKLKRNEDV